MLSDISHLRKKISPCSEILTRCNFYFHCKIFFLNLCFHLQLTLQMTPVFPTFSWKLLSRPSGAAVLPDPKTLAPSSLTSQQLSTKETHPPPEEAPFLGPPMNWYLLFFSSPCRPFLPITCAGLPLWPQSYTLESLRAWCQPSSLFRLWHFLDELFL